MARALPSIGDLRERVSIQRVTNTRDTMGGTVESWEALGTVYAQVEPASAGEQYRRNQIQAAADWTVRIRYSNTYLPKDRMTWRGHTFEIVGLKNPDQRRQFLEIACKELQVAATEIQSAGNVTFDSTTAAGFDSTTSWTMDQAA